MSPMPGTVAPARTSRGRMSASHVQRTMPLAVQRRDLQRRIQHQRPRPAGVRR
ncbi:hypothetical protein BCR34DRAFT_555984 [Clohesyomyces aquaticus]|uniref:Uncharacterized protein n=1 Tax=Clohesyomyces aquaticus TaxID=1231657 RepID=A0A1Y2A3N3_9PLEO|nr:hypothetical protein BCR34DRAFT_555984 [Clohesyomyces aquaticus]